MKPMRIVMRHMCTMLHTFRYDLACMAPEYQLCSLPTARPVSCFLKICMGPSYLAINPNSTKKLTYLNILQPTNDETDHDFIYNQ